ncbi:polysaccharide biosynthesis/export family protein [Loktanella sp. DJP18]|uniref:polysaccharide biosynthesis/export family protein n=1 Tax=Loktanella sp. DJP18 TaxID=3409788 RepID=UPI003BB762FA
MTRLYRSLAGFILCAALAACNSPRGAGFQSEVLAAENTTTDANGDPIYDFAVFPVTRESLPIIQSWPANNLRQYKWIAHQNQPQSLLISPGDTLQVAIWDTEENSLLTGAGQRVAELKDMKVGSDGRIFLPFVGSLKVSGMSPQTAREQIQATLENVMPSAQVQLNVDPGRGNTANLVSGVSNPGVFPLADRNVSLLTLLSSGGGVSPNLVNPQVRLFRGSQVYGLSLSRLFEEPELDTVVQGGDRILIEEDERYFLSLGATTREALHAFPKDEVSALDALSIVGGVSAARANPQGILILREYPASAVRAAGPTPDGPPQERVVFTIDLTKADGLFSAAKFKIQSGDLVYGTESPLGTANSIVGIVGNLLLARARI